MPSDPAPTPQSAAGAPPLGDPAQAVPAGDGPTPPRKGPLSFLSGALTSGLLAWLFLGLSRRVLVFYGEHPPHYSAPIAQNIATALKTLIVGMCFLMTFTCAFIALGLALTFVRSLLPAAGDGQSA